MRPRVVYSTDELLFATNKDVLAALPKSNVIYQFLCQCDSWYVGHISQKLQDRFELPIPKFIRFFSFSHKRILPAHQCKSFAQTNFQTPASDSAVGRHLLRNLFCAQHHDDSRFSILAQSLSQFLPTCS